MTTAYSPNEIAYRLINAAESAALMTFDGRLATRKNLDGLAAAIRYKILGQAALGLWEELNIHDASQIEGLEVRISVAPFLKPPLRVHYDWAQTDLPTLIVERAPRGS